MITPNHSHWWEFQMAAAGAAMAAAPSNEAAIPVAEMPPEVPLVTCLRRLVISRGGLRSNTPSSVAHVSALTAANAPAKPNHGQVACA